METTTTPEAVHRSALILAPHGRDAVVAQALLQEAGTASTICPDISAFEAAVDDDTWFAIVTEEAMRAGDLRALSAHLKAQAEWSDLPFIVLTQRGGGIERNPAAARLSEVLGNVIFLERPFHPTTFVSLARTAMRGRERQFDARMRIDALREGEARLRTALLAGHLGSWELDLTTWDLTTSAACKALFGRGSEETFSYDDLLAGIHPEDLERMQAAVRTAIETGSDYAIEYRTVWPDGSIHWAEIRARLSGELGSLHPRLVGVSSDITDRKTAEETLRDLNETLEDRVTERTAALEMAHQLVLSEIEQRERAEEMLRQAQKMEMIGRLTGGVAHDFNNLLMAVLGNLELLRKYIPADPRTDRLIEGARQGAQRGASLTQRLLAFARRQDLKVEATNVVDLIRGMTDLIERSLGSGIELSMDLSPTAPFALIDSNQVELAVLNLVVNGRDAMPKGGALAIEVDGCPAPPRGDLKAGNYVRILVRDTGHGMDPETLKKAIEPFFSTKELGKGTGLGLSMVQGLAVQMNGALKLTSETGLGTTAELWLPATERVEKKVAADPGRQPVEALPPRMRILVVDDDPLISSSTIAMLQDLGHDAIEANSGEQALKILRRDEAIALVVTDYLMPKMTGLQLAQEARRLRPDLPMLLVSGYAEVPAGSEVNLPRLAKPYQQKQLAREILKLAKIARG